MRKGIIGIIAIILLVLVGSLAWGRLRPDSATQASALALLQPERQPGGRNAWATFWLLDYDVPADQLDAVYARERQHLFDRAGRLSADPASPPPYEPLVAKTYPKLPEIGAGDRARLCRGVDADCLGKVREQASSLRVLLAQQAPKLAQLRSITPADVLWDDTPLDHDTPIPPFNAAEDLLLTAAALDFVEGRQPQALAQVCDNVRVLRYPKPSEKRHHLSRCEGRSRRCLN